MTVMTEDRIFKYEKIPTAYLNDPRMGGEPASDGLKTAHTPPPTKLSLGHKGSKPCGPKHCTPDGKTSISLVTNK